MLVILLDERVLYRRVQRCQIRARVKNIAQVRFGSLSTVRVSARVLKILAFLDEFLLDMRVTISKNCDYKYGS